MSRRRRPKQTGPLPTRPFNQPGRAQSNWNKKKQGFATIKSGKHRHTHTDTHTHITNRLTHTTPADKSTRGNVFRLRRRKRSFRKRQRLTKGREKKEIQRERRRKKSVSCSVDNVVFICSLALRALISALLVTSEEVCVCVVWEQ